MIESAINLTLPASLDWGKAIRPNSLLTAVDITAALDYLDNTDKPDGIDLNPPQVERYNIRDRELAYRDMVVASKLLQVFLKVTTVWNFKENRPRIPYGVADPLYAATQDVDTVTSKPQSGIVHVNNNAVAADALKTDKHLYERDLVLYQALAKGSFDTFGSDTPIDLLTGVPITSLDSPTLNISSVWSLAEGIESALNVSPSLPMSVDIFKKPDQNLADRDNKLAALISRLIQTLKNPFTSANRLLVKINYPDTTSSNYREPETYVLAVDTGTERIWRSEPALSDRGRLIYNKNNKTLRWIPEDSNLLHIPQEFNSSFTVNGIEATQTVEVLPTTQTATSANFWRQKSKHINFLGTSKKEFKVLTRPTDSGAGFLRLTNGTGAITVANPYSLKFTGTAPAGRYNLLLLAKPASKIEIYGAQTTSTETSDPETSGVIFPSAPHQVDWTFHLPPGTWNLEIFYTNYSGAIPSAFPAEIVWDGIFVSGTSWPFNAANGTVKSQVFVVTATGFDQILSVNWTSSVGDEKLLITKLRFSKAVNQNTALRYQILLDHSNGSGNYDLLDVTTVRDRMDVYCLKYVLQSSTVDPNITLRFLETQALPLTIYQAELQQLSQEVGTPNADGFEYWRGEMLSRGLRDTQSAYQSYLESFIIRSGEVTANTTYAVEGGTIKYETLNYVDGNTFVGAESSLYTIVDGTPTVTNASRPIPELRLADPVYDFIWTADTMDIWVNSLKSYDSKFTSAFRLGRPGDLGQPALLPAGLEIKPDGKIKANYGLVGMIPTLQALQPWMLELSCCVAHEDFWVNFDGYGNDYVDNFQPQLGLVTISPSNGTGFTTFPQTITLTHGTGGVTIYHAIDGVASGTSTSFSIAGPKTITAWAAKTGFLNSEISTSQILLVTTPGATDPPSITTNPQGATISATSSVTFTVQTSSATQVYYQWRKNGQPIEGATESSYVIQSAQPVQSGSYSVEARNQYGSVISLSAVLTVTGDQSLAAPIFTVQPHDTVAYSGQVIEFKVEVIGIGWSIRWQFNGVDLPENGDVFPLSTTLTFNAQTSRAGRYRAIAWNTAGVTYSEEAVLTVLQGS
jgi:hypothetical protein